MPLNDVDAEFSTFVEDEAMLDGTRVVGPREIGSAATGRRTELIDENQFEGAFVSAAPGVLVDYGPGSRAEDGYMEIGAKEEDHAQRRRRAHRYGNAETEFHHRWHVGSTEGPNQEGVEIGSTEAADRGGFEIGLLSEGAQPYEIGRGSHGPSHGNPPRVGDLSSIVDWDKTTAYSPGAIVRYWGSYYKATQPVSSASILWGNDVPDSDTARWTQLTAAQVVSMVGSTEIGVDTTSDDYRNGWNDGRKDAGMMGPDRNKNYNPPLIFGRDDYKAGYDGAQKYMDATLGSTEAADREGVEIGADPIVAVIQKARDNRQPAPPMKAVSPDAPLEGDGDFLSDIVIGVAESTGSPDPFPLTTKLLQRFGAGGEPRYVRVDTEDSYKAFRTDTSPDMAELRQRVDELHSKLEAHLVDPEAHMHEDALQEDIDDLTMLGEEVKQAEESKRVDFCLPAHYQGLVTMWREGDFVCASMALPGGDGEVRICTSLEPVRKCVEEMTRHAAEAGVPASAVVGELPAMGCILGAGTAVKEMAAGAKAILQRPEAVHPAPFVVRIEPKNNPATSALAALVMLCRQGDAQACDEWTRLAAASPPIVKQAMTEVVQLVKQAAGE